MDYDNITKLSNKEVLNYLKLYQEGNLEARSKIITGCIPYVKRIVSNKFSYALNEDILLEDLIEVGIFGIIRAIDKFDFSKGLSFFYYAFYYINLEVLGFINLKNKKNIYVSYDKMLDDLNNNKQTIISNFDLEKGYFEKEIISVMRKCLDSLDLNTQNIIKDYYGIDTPKLRLIDISLKYNISTTRLSKLITISLYRIRLEMNKNEYYGAIK